MAWGKGREPKFNRIDSSIEDLLKREEGSILTDTSSFIKFLRTLDWDKTAMFYEEEQLAHSGKQGYRVVHFNGKADKEHWHNAWGQTWCGTSSWMS